jgi:hypothetical protein
MNAAHGQRAGMPAISMHSDCRFLTPFAPGPPLVTRNMCQTACLRRVWFSTVSPCSASSLAITLSRSALQTHVTSSPHCSRRCVASSLSADWVISPVRKCADERAPLVKAARIGHCMLMPAQPTSPLATAEGHDPLLHNVCCVHQNLSQGWVTVSVIQPWPFLPTPQSQQTLVLSFVMAGTVLMAAGPNRGCHCT